MANIDDLFKKPSLPSKRKLEVSHDPSAYYKSARVSPNGDVKTTGSSAAAARAVTVEDEPEDVDMKDNDDEDEEAGPALPPDFDEEENPDDEDGRFFGGGVDSNAKAAMNYLDELDAEDSTIVEEKYDIAWLRKTATAFDKKISLNETLRAKYETDPQKFMKSEADLDDAIKQLSILAQHPELYLEFAQLEDQGGIASLVGLLAHENADVAVDAIHIVSELVDEDVGAEEEQWTGLVKAALDADLLSLVVQNLERLDESQEVDRQGVYDALNVVESLASGPDFLKGPVLKVLLKWLLARIQKKGEKDLEQNRFYAAEMLSILAMTSPEMKHELAKMDAVEVALQLLAPYRRTDPADVEEIEFLENIFDALTSMVEDDPAGKEAFMQAEGIELMLIMLRDGGKISKSKGLSVLDRAMSMSSKPASTSSKKKQDEVSAISKVCDGVVEAQGLKTIFGSFMKLTDPERRAKKAKAASKNKAKAKAAEEAAVESSMMDHFLGVFDALLRRLPADTEARLRLLAKFVERDYEKIDRLVMLRKSKAQRLKAVDARIAKEREGLDEEELDEKEVEWLGKRLDAGLYSLQALDTVLAWLCAEDSGAKEKIQKLLKEDGESLKDIRSTLKGHLDGIADDDNDALGLKEMLQALIEVL